MALVFGEDGQGCFVKFGKAGHKYRYGRDSDIGKERATRLAQRQGVAIMAACREKRK